jgi:hypothetical protein
MGWTDHREFTFGQFFNRKPANNAGESESRLLSARHCMQQTLAIRSQWLLWLPRWGVVHEGAFFDDGSLNSFILNILINVNEPGRSFPRGLKPGDFLGVCGMAEAMPFQSMGRDLWWGERRTNAGPFDSADVRFAQASRPRLEWILAMSSFGCTGLASTSKW